MGFLTLAELVEDKGTILLPQSRPAGIRGTALSPSRVDLASPSILGTLPLTTSPSWPSLGSRVHAALGIDGGGWGRTRLSRLPLPCTEDLLPPNQVSGDRSRAGLAEAGGYIVLQEGMRGRPA